ncbi:hypothetical protein FHX14_000455 [Rhizobium sp. BK619]|nr:hypothetical protein [Rhizobium sp. BK619]
MKTDEEAKRAIVETKRGFPARTHLNDGRYID